MKNYDDEIYTEDSEEQTPKKKKFNIFDWYYNREKNDAKDDNFNPSKEPTFKNFFKLLWRKLNKLTSCNLFFIFANFPLIFLIIGMSGILTTQSTAPYYQSILSLNGAMLFDSNPNIFPIRDKATSAFQNKFLFRAPEWFRRTEAGCPSARHRPLLHPALPPEVP